MEKKRSQLEIWKGREEGSLRDKSLPQETRKISNKQSNLTPKETRKRITSKTQS